ncbi:GxxExxY protein [Termitidicoccus mucosus]|uniref:GxxExxY protein n=1 Tax=Termitidicoccus mucosus TaxID=1184151 RepID=A0A178IEL6_9BACT|nr:GxxExxY protein [Opitutaceae bacterium TSB47]
MSDTPEQQPYDLSGKIIGLAMKIHSTLGPGFLESVYQNALAHELRRANIPFQTEVRLNVHYEDAIVGIFDADMVVTCSLIVENKSVQKLALAHEVQLVNYLTATKIEEGLLLNFGSDRLEFKKKYRHRSE